MARASYTLIKKACISLCAVFCLVACNKGDSVVSASDESKPKIKIRGSESELNLVQFFVNCFQLENNDVTLELAGGGSGIGVEALLNNNVNIASTSRMLTEEEKLLADEKKLIPIPIIVALDAIAIITHQETGIDSLSLEQLGKIFNGTITNWSQVGGRDIEIKVITRGSKSGTSHYLAERLLIEKYSENALIKDKNSEILEAVKMTKGSIGYVNLGSVLNSHGKPYGGIWAVNTYYDGGKAHSPFELEAIKSGEYPLVRPLYQYVIGFPKGNVLDFINYELSENVQKRILELGYFPITPIHSAINSKNIPTLKNTFINL
jgi:phosphate transport system substrate-binding protein